LPWLQPCAIYAKLLLNLDVCRLVLHGDYLDELALKLLREAGFTREAGGPFTVWNKANASAVG